MPKTFFQNPSDEQSAFDLAVGKSHGNISLLSLWADDGTFDEPNRATLKAVADRMIEVGSTMAKKLTAK